VTVSSTSTRTGKYAMSTKALRGLYRVVGPTGSASRTFAG
jgi:hypothetical protein